MSDTAREIINDYIENNQDKDLIRIVFDSNTILSSIIKEDHASIIFLKHDEPLIHLEMPHEVLHRLYKGLKESVGE